MPKKRSLAEELAELFNPAPAPEVDPEAEGGEDRAFLREEEEGIGLPGESVKPTRAAREKGLRLRADIVLDEDAAYKGRRSSRAAVFGDGANGMSMRQAVEEEDGEEGEEDESMEEQEEEEEEESEQLIGQEERDAEDQQQEEEEEEDTGSEEQEEDVEDEEVEDGSEEEGVGKHRPRQHVGGTDEGMNGDPSLELEREYQRLQQASAPLQAAAQQRASRERAKGAAVRRQRLLWERTLELRIMLQRCLQGANRLPLGEARDLAAARAGEALQTGYQELQQACSQALEVLLELHTALVDNHPGAAAVAMEARGGTKRQRLEGEGHATGGGEEADPAGFRKETHEQGQQARPVKGALDAEGAAGGLGNQSSADAAWAAVDAAVEEVASFRDASLDRWHRRTVLSSGSAALRGSASLRALNQSISAQVSALLRDGMQRVLARTFMPHAVAPRRLGDAQEGMQQQQLGHGAGEDGAQAEGGSLGQDGLRDERNLEAFEDGEFYTQLLKELLDANSADGAGAALAAARGPKRRRQVDRRASKGRKLRYQVMDKLVNFCAPEEQVAPAFAPQLFANLFSAP